MTIIYGTCVGCARKVKWTGDIRSLMAARSSLRCSDCQAVYDANPPPTPARRPFVTSRECSVCHRPTGSQATRCPLHPKRWQGGGRRSWRVQRERILERDGRQCTFVLNGVRCPETAHLEVHHLYSGSVIGVPDEELVTVCRKHNPRGG